MGVKKQFEKHITGNRYEILDRVSRSLGVTRRDRITNDAIRKRLEVNSNNI